MIPTGRTYAHTLWILPGRACTGISSRPQSVTQNTTTVVTGDADPAEYTHIYGPFVPFIARLYVFG